MPVKLIMDVVGSEAYALLNTARERRR